MEKRIVLESKQVGFVSGYVWSIIWTLGLLYVASWASGRREAIGNYDFPWPHVCMYSSLIIVAIIILCNLWSMFYSAREINELSYNGKGVSHSLVCTVYGFPFSKQVKHISFDRIICIDVQQESIGRLINTGSLVLTLVTFTNADSQKEEWTIPGIQDPQARKEEIKNLFPGHEGALIRIKED